MTTFLLAILSGILIVLSSFLLYKIKKKSILNTSDADHELERLKMEIEKLAKIIEDSSQFHSDYSSDLSNFGVFEDMIGYNLPLMEITDLELSEERISNGEDISANKATFKHQLRFYVFNIGRNSLTDVVISIKDIYNDPKDIKKRSRIIGQNDDDSIDLKDVGIGVYENFEINILNLKSRQLVYLSTLPNSFGVAEYSFSIVVEWKDGFYQMDVKIEEFDGKLKYFYQYFDINGDPINFELLESNIKK